MQIEIIGLCKDYVSEGKTVRALNNINLTIPENEFFTLLGPSGCGKTTLLRCIVGLETPTEGEIRIGGEVVWSKAKNIALPPEKRGLGMVFQTYAIWPHMSVFDNIAYPLQVRGEKKNVIREKVMRTLDFVQLTGLQDRSATRLSGGQQQRVALARALVAEPKVILFDEPLSNLDAKLREETRKQLRHFLNDLDITAVYVTHDRVEALALSDNIAVMRSGQVIEVGSPQKIYFNADHRFVADFIGRANQINARVTEQRHDVTIVECGLGQMHCQRRDLEIGAEVTLCIRPEFVRISKQVPTCDHNRFEGTVTAMEFVGEVYEAEVQIGNESLLASIDPNIEVKEGDTVRFSLEPANCLLLSA